MAKPRPSGAGSEVSGARAAVLGGPTMGPKETPTPEPLASPQASLEQGPTRPCGAPMGEMGKNNLGDVFDFSCIVNHILLYFWGFNYSKMVN